MDTGKICCKGEQVIGRLRSLGGAKDKMRPQIMVSGIARLLTITLLLLLLLGLAVDWTSTSPAPASGDNQFNYNLVENLISEYLDNASDRYKKSKMNGLRQVKQTLRFGRRSDPWFAPGISQGEQVSLEELRDSQQLFGPAATAAK